jgi:hypothetical protein
MSTEESAAGKSAATAKQKRAQWEAFDYDVLEIGVVQVTNHSHETPSEHQYRVDVDPETGATAACECPSDQYGDGPCKHRLAVDDTPAVLAAASGLAGEPDADDSEPAVATDGGEAPNERPADCECHRAWHADDTPCFVCYEAGFETPNPDAGEADPFAEVEVAQ